MVPPVLEFVPHIRYKTEEAAAMLAVSPSYLRKLRTKGGGPRFQQMDDTNCYYTYEDLKAWSDSLPRFSNNSEYQVHKEQASRVE